LLLLTPERFAKHVVAEVLIDDRWIVVDATYRMILRDAEGRMLTRKELQNPQTFAEATGKIPNYLPIYDYKSFAHVRIARLPMDGLGLRRALQAIYPGWDEAAEWSLLLERESFFYFFISALLVLLFTGARGMLAWYADHRLRVPRFRVRHGVARAGAGFFSAPELKE
jgi:hypothetical protein